MGSPDAVVGALQLPPWVRLRQGLKALFARRSPVPLPDNLGQLLPAEIAVAWSRLSPYDQHHLVAVACDLHAHAATHDVVLAGLLHDIGKAGRVTVVDRAGAVVLRYLAPQLGERLLRHERSLPGLHGLHLLVRHAERGADLLASVGMPAGVVWLVRHHERDLDNADLRALQAADHRH